MASIFGSTCDGGVFKVPLNCQGTDDQKVAPVTIEPGIGAIPITGFTLDLGTNHQFLHSLDEFIYVFPFGDRVGELTITGLGFLGACNESAADGQDQQETTKGIYDYYIKKRLSQKEGFEPTRITISKTQTPLLGFLTGLHMETLRPEMPIVQWVLRYNVIIGK